VVAGSGGYQATAVGADAYARKLAAQARRFAPVRSELVDGINRIMRYVTWTIAPVAVLLVISQGDTVTVPAAGAAADRARAVPRRAAGTSGPCYGHGRRTRGPLRPGGLP